MSWYSFWQVVETDVLLTIAKVKQGIQVLEKDLQNINSWVLSNAPAIATDIQAVLGVVTSMTTGGMALPASVLVAAKAAEEAAAGLAMYVEKSKAGSTTVSAVIGAYTAIKQAHEAHAQTAIAIAQTPVAQSQAASLGVKK